VNRAITRRIVAVVGLQAIYGAMLFGGAGTLQWPRAWAYLALGLVLFTANLLYVLPRNPAAIAARAKVGEGTKAFDKVFGAVFGVAVLGMHLSAGLETMRFGAPAPGVAGIVAGAALLVLGDLPVAWSMATNPHLEKTVRIQEHHDVITHGPYAIVRHPMYVGVIVQYVGIPLFFGSALSGAWAALSILALIVRTALEDRTLRAELPGYADYAANQTRYRLLPGVW